MTIEKISLEPVALGDPSPWPEIYFACQIYFCIDARLGRVFSDVAVFEVPADFTRNRLNRINDMLAVIELPGICIATAALWRDDAAPEFLVTAHLDAAFSAELQALFFAVFGPRAF